MRRETNENYRGPLCWALVVLVYIYKVLLVLGYTVMGRDFPPEYNKYLLVPWLVGMVGVAWCLYKWLTFVQY